MSRYKLQFEDRNSLRNTKNSELQEELHRSSKSFEKLFLFLKQNRLEDYFGVFKDNEIFFEDLQFLKENDIIDLNLPIGPRNRLTNALANFENFQLEDFEEEEKNKEGNENNKKYKEIIKIATAILQQQNEMMDAIKKCQSDLNELKEEHNTESCNRTNSMIKLQKDTNSSTSPSFNRLAKPTLSSIAKQKVLPNKYMHVSPLRVSYYSRITD